MHKDQQIDRFRDVLREVMAEEPEDLSRIPLEPLSADMEAKLLQISLAPAPIREPWHRRVRRWIDERTSPRNVALVLVPAAVLIVVLVGMPRRAAPVDDFTLLAARTVSPQTPTGRVLLGASNEPVVSTQELRIGKRDALTLLLRAPRVQKGAVDVRSFIRRGSEIKAWGVTLEPVQDGSFRLHQPIEELPQLGADQELLFQVGRPEALLSAEALQAGKRPDERLAHLYSLRLLVQE